MRAVLFLAAKHKILLLVENHSIAMAYGSAKMNHAL
jgi:hypothetical protein